MFHIFLLFSRCVFFSAAFISLARFFARSAASFRLFFAALFRWRHIFAGFSFLPFFATPPDYYFFATPLLCCLRAIIADAGFSPAFRFYFAFCAFASFFFRVVTIFRQLFFTAFRWRHAARCCYAVFFYRYSLIRRYISTWRCFRRSASCSCQHTPIFRANVDTGIEHEMN